MSEAERIEELVFSILESGPEKGEDRLEQAISDHPEWERELRSRFAALQRFGFLDEETQTSVQAAPEAGDRFGEYRLRRLIGAGGMGLVYEAEHLRLGGRRVALKLIRPELFLLSRARERFEREALLASRIDHPALCALYETGEVDVLSAYNLTLEKGHSNRTVVNLTNEDLGTYRVMVTVQKDRGDVSEIETHHWCTVKIGGA